MSLKIGDLVKVLGRSQLGKNRIAEHGAVWKVVKIWKNDILLNSTDGEDYGRWVKGDDDSDFELLRVVTLGKMEK